MGFQTTVVVLLVIIMLLHFGLSFSLEADIIAKLGDKIDTLGIKTDNQTLKNRLNTRDELVDIKEAIDVILELLEEGEQNTKAEEVLFDLEKVLESYYDKEGE